MKGHLKILIRKIFFDGGKQALGKGI